MNLSILLIVTFTLTSIQDSSFVIKGKVIGHESGNVRLGQIGESWLDSKECKVIDGEFIFEGEIQHPEEFFVAYQKDNNTRESNYFRFLIEPGSDNTIMLNANDIYQSEFNGSRIGNQYSELQQERDTFDSESAKWIPQYQAAMDAGDSTRLTEIIEKFDSIKHQEILWKKRFIWENPNSYISALWLHKDQFNINNDTLQRYFDHLNKDLKESKYYVKIRNYLDVQEGKPFLDFELNDFDGKIYRLSSFAKDKVVLIDFWASWCGPCREHNVQLKTLYEDNKSKGFEVLGISLDRDTTAFFQAIEEDEMTWLNLLDRTDKYSVHGMYENNAIPFNILIDNKGIIAYRANDYEKLEQEVERLLGN